MSEKKLINLDALVSESQKIQLHNKEYELLDPPILSFLQFQKAIEECENEMAQMEVAMTFLYSLCPKANEEKAFDSLTIKQLNALVNVLAGTVEKPENHIGEQTEEDTKKK